MILPYDSHSIDMTVSPEPINGTTGDVWRHDHNVDDQNMAVLPIVGVDLPCLRRKFAIKIQFEWDESM